MLQLLLHTPKLALHEAMGTGLDMVTGLVIEGASSTASTSPRGPAIWPVEIAAPWGAASLAHDITGYSLLSRAWRFRVLQQYLLTSKQPI